MRDAPSAGDNTQRDTACPILPSAASNVKITLEEDDDYLAGGSYSPVFLLPRSAYALASFSVADSSGALLLPASSVSLGQDSAYPWTVEASAISYSATSPPAAPATPPGFDAT